MPVMAPPAAATGYTYPVMPAGTVPGAHRQLSHLRLLIIAGVALAIIVAAVSVIALAARPSVQPCGLYCGPHQGPRLLAPTAYHNAKFGYTVEYDGSQLQVAGSDDNGVQLQAADGDGEVVFTAAAGGDTNGANQTALASLPSTTFQDMQTIGPVRGAEIGFVNGVGTAYSAQFVPSDGSQAVPVSIAVFSASSNGVTITVLAFSGQTNDIADAPYGLDKASVFDYPASNTIWEGQ